MEMFLASSKTLWLTVSAERHIGEKARGVVREVAQLVKGRIMTSSINYLMNMYLHSPLLLGHLAQPHVNSRVFQLTSR